MYFRNIVLYSLTNTKKYMILNESKADVIISGDFEETEFSIDTESDYIIFDMLRSKIYKNNIGAICREVASNSRDAQREIGDFTTPIEIEISDRRDHFFYEDGLNLIFRDRGVGISPERVKNIYTKYGASTKRKTNTQTGGFGLGAKTPFSYSDAFIVRTIVDGIEYSYSIYIDPSRKGKMALLFQEPVEHEGNLTEIIIPIKEPDLGRFKKEILRNTHFWKVRPNLIKFDEKYHTFTRPSIDIGETPFEVSGEYCIIQKEDFVESNVNAIVDGIYYPVDMKILDFDFSNEKFAICLFYNNGELNIAANRETLQYDDATIKSIKDKVNIIFDQFRAKFISEIASQPDLFHAQYMYNKFRNSNHLFKVSSKNHVFDYKGTSLMSSTTWKPKTMYMFVLKHNYGSPTYKMSIDNLFSEDVFRNFADGCVHVSQKDNEERKKRLSIPISRTIFTRNKNQFVMFSTKTIEDIGSYYYNAQEFERDQKEDFKILNDMGIKLVDYWSVVPDKIPHEKREKKETVVMKTFYDSGSYDRTFEMKYVDRWLHIHGVVDTNIYYFGVDDERKLEERLERQLRKVQEILREVEPKMKICIASKVKRRFFKNYQTIESLIEKHKGVIEKFVEREELESITNEIYKYKDLPVNLDKSEDLAYLMKVKLVKKVDCSKILNFIRENMPTFVLNYKRASNYKNITIDIEKAYPHIGIMSSYKGASEAKKYVLMINELNELRKFKLEQVVENSKYNHFIN